MGLPVENPITRSVLTCAVALVALVSRHIHGELFCGNGELFTKTRISSIEGECHIFVTNDHLGPVLEFIPGGLYNVTVRCDAVGGDSIRALHIRVVSGGSEVHGLLPAFEDVCGNSPEYINTSNKLSPLEFRWKAPERTSKIHCVNFTVTYVDSVETLYQFTHQICRVSDCLYYYYEDTGVIASENYPNRYGNNLNCTYYILPESGRQPYLQFQSFDIEKPDHGHCYDHVIIEGAVTPPTPYCGTFVDFSPETMFFSAVHGVLVIQFLSDMKIKRSGFQALFYTLADSECNTTLSALKGTVSSTNYPAVYYPKLDCVTRITVPATHTILLTVHDMDIPGRSGCTEDYLEVLSPSDSGTEDGNRWRRCGSDENYSERELVFQSAGSSIDVHFHTDHLKEGRGFSAQYQAIQPCADETETEIHGSLSSQNFPKNYSNSQDCSSVIQFNTSMYRVELKFRMLHTESSGNAAEVDDQCTLDYVEIDNGRRLHRRCGDWKGREAELHFRSVGSTLVLRFVSNERVTAPGFEVTWNAVLSDTSGIVCPDGWEDSEESCFQINKELNTWFEGKLACEGQGAELASIRDDNAHLFIQAEIKSRLNDSFPRTFWIGANDRQFENDFYWVDGTRVERYYWFPGWVEHGYEVKQPSDDGFSNEDCVEMRQSFHLPLKGEQQTEEFYWNDRNCDAKNGFICQMYKNQADRPARPEPPACNSTTELTLLSPSGRITSPGYPANYSDFLHCSFQIRAPLGYRIEVEFETFDLEDSESCAFDNVEISPFTHQPTVTSFHRVCGNYNRRIKLLRHISMTNQLAITFHTDHSVVAGGFAANVHLVNASWTCGNGSWIAFGVQCYALFISTPVTHQKASSICNDMAAVLSKPNTSAELTFIGSQMSPGTSGKGNIWAPEVRGSFCYTLSNSGDAEIKLVKMPQACTSKFGFICSRPAEDVVKKREEISSHDFSGEWRLTRISGQFYENNIESILHIQLPENFRIFVNISVLDIELQDDCLYDFLEFLELGETNKSKRYCGHQSDTQHYVTSGNGLSLKFRSDYSIGGKGFLLSWVGYNMSECTSQNTNAKDVIQSLNNPISYFHNMDCHITIEAPTNFRIYLEIQLLDLWTSGDNCSDYLEVNLGHTVTRLCPELNQHSGLMTYLSKGSEMKLWFHSDGNGGGRGFQAQYSRVPAVGPQLGSVLNVIGKTSGVVRSVNYDVGGIGDIEEVVVIHAGLGRIIDLHVGIHVSTVTEESCNDTYMEVLDKPANPSGLDSRISLCGSTKTLTEAAQIIKGVRFQSHLHEVEIRFKTGQIGDSPNIGFVVVYKVLPDPEFFNKTRNVTDVSFPACSAGPYSCYNGGTCTASSAGGFQCKCPGFYTGLLCHATWCEVDRCVRGTCNLTSTYYTCLCDPGYYGTYCQLDRDACRTKHCDGHGECWRENEQHVVCECDIDYSGPSCATRITPPMTPRSATQRLLEEPIWIGLIVILSLVLIFVIMFCIKRKCSRRLERCCCQDKTKKKQQQEQNGHVDRGISSPSLPSNNSYLSREPSPLDFRRQPEIHIEEVPDENLTTPASTEHLSEDRCAFVFENHTLKTSSPFHEVESDMARYSESTPKSTVMGPSVAGSFVLNADQINTEVTTENPLAVLKLKPHETREPPSRLNRGYSSTPALHREFADVIKRPKSLEGVWGHHFYPHIIISNEHGTESTTDDGTGITDTPAEVADENSQKDRRFTKDMYSLSIPSGPDYYVEYDAQKKRRDFALKSHSANAMYNWDQKATHSPKYLWDRSTSTESEFRAASRLRRGLWNNGSWEVSYSDSGLGNQSSYESCHSSYKRQRTCQCRKCIKYDRRHHHKHSGHSRHGYHKSKTGNYSDATVYPGYVETTSSTESDRRAAKQRLSGSNKHSGRRMLRRHETVEKCDSSNSEKDYKRPPRRSLGRSKSQDTDWPPNYSVKPSNKSEYYKDKKSRSSNDIVLDPTLKTEAQLKDFQSSDMLPNCESSDSYLSKSPAPDSHTPSGIAVISDNYNIIDEVKMIRVIKSSSDDEYSGVDNPETRQAHVINVPPTEPDSSSQQDVCAPLPLRVPNVDNAQKNGVDPDQNPPLTPCSSRRIFVKDSAYQTKENSTDKSNSKTTSSAPSPEISCGLDRLEKTFPSWSSVRADERRVTSQLQMAALKLAQLQRRSMENKTLRNGRIYPIELEDGAVQEAELTGCLPLRPSTLDTSRRRTGKLRRLHSLNRESSLQEVTEENSPVVPDDAYQSAPETFIQNIRQSAQFNLSVNGLDNIEMKDLS